MEHTVYSKTQEKVTIGDVKFTVTVLIPKMSQEVKETRKKKKSDMIYILFSRSTPARKSYDCTCRICAI